MYKESCLRWAIKCDNSVGFVPGMYSTLMQSQIKIPVESVGGSLEEKLTAVEIPQLFAIVYAHLVQPLGILVCLLVD